MNGFVWNQDKGEFKKKLAPHLKLNQVNLFADIRLQFGLEQQAATGQHVTYQVNSVYYSVGGTM